MLFCQKNMSHVLLCYFISPLLVTAAERDKGLLCRIDGMTVLLAGMFSLHLLIERVALSLARDDAHLG